MDSELKRTKHLLYNESTGGVFIYVKKGRTNNKYSLEFKKNAMEKYFSVELVGLGNAAKKSGLKSHRQLHDWVKFYRKDSGLLADVIEEIFHETHKDFRFIWNEIIRRHGIIYNDKTIHKYMKILNLSFSIRDSSTPTSPIYG